MNIERSNLDKLVLQYFKDITNKLNEGQYLAMVKIMFNILDKIDEI